jgi:hypothetical protein
VLTLEPNEPIFPVGIEISTFFWRSIRAVDKFLTPLLTPDLVNSPMDARLHPCHTCKQLKPLREFKLRTKDDPYGKKSDPTVKVSPETNQREGHTAIEGEIVETIQINLFVRTETGMPAAPEDTPQGRALA